MVYRALADLVVVTHLAFIVFVMLGGLLALRFRLAPLAHLPAVLWGVYVELSGSLCPLTPLENTLRREAGASGYDGGFVEHYLVPILYPAGLTESLQVVLAAAVILANGLVYALVVWRRVRRTRSGDAST